MPNWFFSPLTNYPTRLGKQLEEDIDPTNASDRGYVRPFIAGSMEGAGNVLSDMTSPFSLLSMGAGRVLRGIQGVSQLNKLRALQQAPISPSFLRLGPEFLPDTEEAMSAFNRMRKGEEAARKAKMADEAYESARMSGKHVPIAPSDNEVTDFMARIAKARGR